jgi:hypothetical protein
MQGLYERAVALHCTDAGLWEDYLLFQVSELCGLKVHVSCTIYNVGVIIDAAG